MRAVQSEANKKEMVKIKAKDGKERGSSGQQDGKE